MFASSTCATPSAGALLDIRRPYASEVAFRRPADNITPPTFGRTGATLRDKDPYTMLPTAGLRALRELASARQAKPREAASQGTGRWTADTVAALIGKLASQHKVQDANAAFQLARTLGLCDAGVCMAMLKAHAGSGHMRTALSLGVLRDAQGAGWQPQAQSLAELVVACGKARDMAGADAVHQAAHGLLGEDDGASWRPQMDQALCRAAGHAGDVARVRQHMDAVQAGGGIVPLPVYISLVYALVNCDPRSPALAGPTPPSGGIRKEEKEELIGDAAGLADGGKYPRADAAFAVLANARQAALSPDTALMNACLRACARDGDGDRALATLADMEAGQLGPAAIPNRDSFLVAVRACGARQLDNAFTLVEHAIREGTGAAIGSEHDGGQKNDSSQGDVAAFGLALYNSLIHAASAAGQPGRAREAMEAARAAGLVPDASSYCALLMGYLCQHDLAGYAAARREMEDAGVAANWKIKELDLRVAAESGDVRRVSSALLASKSRRVLPRHSDYVRLLWACSQGNSWASLDQVLGIKSQMLLQGIIPETSAFNLMLKCCQAPGRPLPHRAPSDDADAEGQREGDKEGGVLEPSSMKLSANGAANTWSPERRVDAAEQILGDMLRLHVPVTSLTLERLMFVYAQAGDRARTEALLARVKAGEFAPHVTAATPKMFEAAVRCYSRGGDMEGSLRLVEEMRAAGMVPRVGAYTAIMLAYGYTPGGDLDAMFAFLDSARAEPGVTAPDGQLAPPVFSALATSCVLRGAPGRALALLGPQLARQGPLHYWVASAAMALYAATANTEGARALLERVKGELGGPPVGRSTRAAGRLVFYYLLAVKVCGAASDAPLARALFGECEQLGLLEDRVTGWRGAMRARAQMSRALAAACAAAGDTQGALDVIYASRRQGDVVGGKTYRAVLASATTDSQRRELAVLMKMDYSQDPLQLEEGMPRAVATATA